MEEIPKIKVIYGKEEFEMTEQQLDRIVAIASKKLRDELIAIRLGYGSRMRKNELKNEGDVKVIKDNYESELYRAMAETIVYAIETGYLDEYALCEPEPAKKIEGGEESIRIDRNAVNTLAKIRNETSHQLLHQEIQKMIFCSNYREKFF